MNKSYFLTIFLFIFAFILNPVVQAADIQENKLVVMAIPGKALETIRASTVEHRDLAVVTTDDTGKRSAWQGEFIKGMVPLFPVKLEEISIEIAESSVEEYNKLLQELPAATEVLKEELSKWNEQLKKLKEQRRKDEAARRKELNTKIDGLLARSYDINQKYNLRALEQLLESGSELAAEMPDRAKELETFLEPWKGHADKLKAGQVFYLGTWYGPEELAEYKEAQVREVLNKFMEEEVQLKMDSVVVPQTSMLLVLSIAVMTLVLVLYMFLWLASSRAGALTFSSILIMLIGVVIVGGYIYFGYKIFNAPASINDYLAGKDQQEEVDMISLQRALFLSSNPEKFELLDTDAEIKLADIQINQLFQNNMTFVREGESKVFDMERTGLAVLFLNDKVTFLDEVAIFGKPLLVRHELAHNITDEAISFNEVKVYLGSARLPGPVVSFFWKKLRRGMAAMIKQTGISEVYEIFDIKEKFISLIMTRKPQGSVSQEDEVTTGAQ